MEKEPALYILMRNDMESMTPGRAAAQASHASNAFEFYMRDRKHPHRYQYYKWYNETNQGFGTAIVLAVNETEMRTAVEISKNNQFIADIVHDPTYPVMDGDTAHLIAVDTCAYVFAPDRHDPILKAILGNFPLY